MILLIATTFFVNTIVARSSEVYPVHRQDFVSNGQPTSLPYKSPRQDGVYRVSRQEFGSPRQQVQYPYKIDLRNDPGAIQYWYPGLVSYDYQNNYPNTISAPSVLKGFPVIPNLFLPAPNQVFKVNVDNAIPTGQPSTFRPRSSPTKSPFEDDSVLPPIPKSSVDEGEPLSALSDYSKRTPGRPIKYIPVNDEVEISEEQKDLLKSYHSPSANKVSAERKEKSRFPPRVRRRAPYNNDERFCQEHDHQRSFHRVKKYPLVPKTEATTEVFDGLGPELYVGQEGDDQDLESDVSHSRSSSPEDLYFDEEIIPDLDVEVRKLASQVGKSIQDKNLRILAKLRSDSAFSDYGISPPVDEEAIAPEPTSKVRESTEDGNSVIPDNVLVVPHSRIAFPDEDVEAVSEVIPSHDALPKHLFWNDKIIPAVDEKTIAPELPSEELESTETGNLVIPDDVRAESHSRIAFPDEDVAAVSEVIPSHDALPKHLFWNDKIITTVDERTIAPELPSEELESTETGNSVVPDDVQSEPHSRIASPNEDVVTESDVIHSRIAFPKDLFWSDKIIPAVDEKTIAPELASEERESIENLVSNDIIITTDDDEKTTGSKFMLKKLESTEDPNNLLAPGDASAMMSMIFDVLRHGPSSNEVDSDYGRETGASGSVEMIPNRAASDFHQGVQSPATATKKYENLTLKDLLSVITHAITQASDLTEEELELLEFIRRHMLDEHDSLDSELSELDEKVKSLLSSSAEKFKSIEENLKRQANTLKREEKGGVLSYKPTLSFIDELKMIKSALLSEMGEDESKSSDSSVVSEREPEVLLHLQKK